MADLASIVHRKCLAMATNAANVGPFSVGAGAAAMKRAVEASLSSVAPSGRLRGVGSKGVKLSVRYDVKGTENPTASVRAVGPWQLIENSTRPHVIVAKRLGKSAAGRQASVDTALAFSAFGGGAGAFGSLRSATTKSRKGVVRQRAGRAALGGGLASAAGGPRPYAHHPGTRGKHPFATGIEAGKPLAVEAMRTATRDAVLKGFRS